MAELDKMHTEKNARVLLVAKAILQGYTKRAFLIQYLSENYDWGCTERTIDNYIKDAKEIIKNQYTEEELQIEKDIALSRLEALFTMNMKIQDYRECRNVTIDRMKLLGLFLDKKEIDVDLIDKEPLKINIIKQPDFEQNN